MKKIFLILFLACFSILTVDAAIETPSTQGSEFFFSFPRARPGRAKSMVLTVSAERAGVLKFIDATSSHTVTTKTFAAGTTTIALASVASSSVSLENDANGSTTTVVTGTFPYCYTIASNAVQNEGYEVLAYESDGVTAQKVSLYAALSGSNTVDAANVYPIKVLGNEYYVATHPGYYQSTELPSEALIVATEDSTIVEIMPTSLLDDQSSTSDIHDKITVTLNKGQTYLLRALSSESTNYGQCDLTGTVIRTKDTTINRTDTTITNTCKRIAVFAGTQHGYPGDYEYDQLFPTHLWGNEFLVVAPEDGGTEVVRVVASKSCTHVTINGTLVATLNQSDHYDYVDTKSKGCYVKTDNPVEVAMFTTPYESQASSKPSNDASMTILAPLQQKLDSIVFTGTTNADATSHKVSIVAPTAYVDSVSFDSLNTSVKPNVWTPISLSSWSVIAADTTYSSVVASISPSSTYKIVSKKGGFNAYVYGYGSGADEYGYSVGAAASVVTTSFNLNGESSTTLSSSYCADSAVTFTPVIPSSISVSYIEWDFTSDGSIDTTTTSTNSYTAIHKYPSPPPTVIYTVTMIVHKSSTGCFDESTTDTVKASFTIKDYVRTDTSVTICKGSAITSRSAHESAFSGSTPNFQWYTTNSAGADSTITGQIDSTFVSNLDYGASRKYWVKTYLNCNIYVDTFYVTVKPITQTSYTLTACYGTSISSKHQSGGDLLGTPTYTWYNQSGTVIATTASITLNSSVGLTYGSSAKFWVQSTSGCAYVDTFNVTIPAKITNALTASSNKVCGDGHSLVTITATESGAIDSSYWQVSTNGSSYVSMTPSVGTYVHAYYPTEEEAFRFISVGACEKDTASTAVAVNTPFTAQLDASSNDFVAPYTLPISGGNITLAVTPSVSGSYKYSWQVSVTDAKVTYSSDGSQYVAAVVSDNAYYVIVSDQDDLCKDTTNTIVINLRKLQLHTLLLPSSSNILNKTFATYDESGDLLINTFIYGYSVEIFNRYGQKIYEKNDTGWDGSYNGKLADAGVYFYVLKYNNSEGKPQYLKGTIEIVK